MSLRAPDDDADVIPFPTPADQIRLLQPRGEAAATDGLLYSFRWNRRHPEYAGLYAPYDLYGGAGQPGLLVWGSDQTEGDYYWLADAESIRPRGRWSLARTASNLGTDMA